MWVKKLCANVSPQCANIKCADSMRNEKGPRMAGPGKLPYCASVHRISNSMATSTKAAIHSVSTTSSAKGRQPAWASCWNEVFRPRAAMASTRQLRDRSLNWCCRPGGTQSEEHTSELQSQSNLVCRLLL